MQPIPVTRNNPRQPIERIKRSLRFIYLKILRIDDPPERIARGAAIGVFMGILPTFGLGIVLSIALAFVLRANKVSAVLGSFIMNPVTTPIFWTISAIVGSIIFWEDSGTILAKIKGDEVLNGIGWAYMVFLAGNLVVSSVFALAVYYLTKRGVERHRLKRALKKKRKKNP